MNSRFIPSAILASVLIFAGCKKADISADKNSELPSPADIAMKKKPPVVNSCQVTQVVHWPGAFTMETMNFTYNTHGDPVSITQVPTPHTGAPNYEFEYDHKKRLTELRGMYASGTSGEFYHKYFYSSPSANAQVYLDSVYIFPEWTGGVLTSWYSAKASWLTYDAQGRIIKDSTIWTTEPAPIVTNYTYDASGNLTGRTYDSQVNVHRTHEIWMFLDRDYSLNNPITADTYNVQGLPTSFNFPFVSGQFLNFLTYMNRATITYACD